MFPISHNLKILLRTFPNSKQIKAPFVIPPEIIYQPSSVSLSQSVITENLNQINGTITAETKICLKIQQGVSNRTDIDLLNIIRKVQRGGEKYCSY